MSHLLMDAARPAFDPEPFLAALAGSSSDAIIGKTVDGVVLFWNQAAERLYGYTADEMIGSEVSVLIPADRSDEFCALLGRVNAGETVRHATTRIRKDGSSVAVALTISPVVDANGSVLGISTIAHDLTRYNTQVADLREAHRRTAETLSTLETLHAGAPIGLGFVDREFRVIHLNDMLASVNGTTVQDQLGHTVAENVPDIWPQIEPLFRQVLDSDEAVLNVEVSGEAAGHPGTTHWLASYYPVHHGGETIGIGMVVVDISERRQAEEFRTIVMDNMVEGLYTIDAQGLLTSINDAAAVMLGWNKADVMGRDVRFLFEADGTHDEAIDAGNKELHKVRGESRRIHLDDHVIRRHDGSNLPVAMSASPLLNGTRVDGAVVVFRDITEERSEYIRVRKELAALTWVGRIREALDEDRFVLYSQSIIPLRGGQPSEELLIRMKGRRGEIIGPDAFLSVAEKYGLITEIDQWVVKQAVALAATGRHVGANLSAESLMTRDLLVLIEDEIRRTGADPSNLVFEITETALMRDIEKGHSFARGLAQLGCQVALDDFGTGFGTFTHVKRLAIKYLKVDIEFVRGLVESSANQHVVKAIVNLAQGFGCETIAEGVEDEETLDVLRDFGVDFAQGYHLGRPAPL